MLSNAVMLMVVVLMMVLAGTNRVIYDNVVSNITMYARTYMCHITER